MRYVSQIDDKRRGKRRKGKEEEKGKRRDRKGKRRTEREWINQEVDGSDVNLGSKRRRRGEDKRGNQRRQEK